MVLKRFRVAAAALALLFCASAQARVVINEVMYHAPSDLDDLEYVELHNTGPAPADIGGWAFSKGIKVKFPAGARIPAQGFLLVARNAARLKEAYGLQPAAVFAQKLSNNGERIELVDANGAVVDAVAYKDQAPWPRGADGDSGSLERIDPESDGENPANWISSPLAPDHRRPGGTPGKPNAGWAKSLPPVISDVRFSPENPGANKAVAVEAAVQHSSDLKEVTLLFRLAGPGFEGPETPAPMRKNSGGNYAGVIPGQPKDQLVRFRIRAVDATGAARFHPAETEPRPALSYYVHDPIQPAKIPFAWIITTTAGEARSGNNQDRFRFGPWRNEARGPQAPFKSAFFYFDPESRRTQLFDFVQVTPRKGGRKVHFYSDQPFEEMTGINLIFEYDERFPLTEMLSYELYRRAGLAVEKSYHVRTWVNGQPLGYQLLVEQPNRGFLRRNQLRDDGNLYKLIWYHQGVVGQHEKKTNTREGHDDLLELMRQLDNTKDRAQWDVIKKYFDVEQVANYFAVNTALSYWDGYFNNYFTYHDLHGTGKWTMYPWDQDKTWGIIDGSGRPFYNMPLTFGMMEDRPPGGRHAPGPGSNPSIHQWWRPPGWFSGPLLTNPYFRRFYLARTREIIDNIYTEKNFYPLIDALGARLRDEIRFRAELYRGDPGHAARQFEQNLQFLRDHLRKRREFLLAQKELQAAGKAASP